MTNEPPFGFGFGPADRDPDRDPESEPGPQDPFGLGAGFPGLPGGMPGMPPGGFDMSQLGQMLTQLGQMLSQAQNTGGGPVNYDLAANIAKQRLAGTTSSLTDAQRSAVRDAVRLAELWLDPATTFPAGATEVAAWSASEWVNASLPTWKRLCDPVAQRVSVAWVEALPEEVRAGAGPMLAMLGQMGGLAFGSQLGGGLGQLAAEVLSSTDVGVPVGPAGTAALLPENIEKFTAGLDRPASEVMIYLAAREAAHQRLFAHVGWLRERLLGTVEEYARGITVDTSRIEELARGIDPSNPGAIEEAMRSGMFEQQTTPAQQVALARLETLLALIEGWVDAVVADAVGDRLPGAAALARDAAQAARRGGTRRADVRDDRRAGTAAAAAAQCRRAVAAPRRAARDRGTRRAVGTPGPDPVGGRPRGPGRLRRPRGARRPDRRAGEGDAGRGAGREGRQDRRRGARRRADLLIPR